MPEIREIAMPTDEFLAILMSTREALRRAASERLEKESQPSAA